VPILAKPTDRHWKPWKNGGGDTMDVAVFPDTAGFDDFDWRVSIARVAEAGPFSIFPGVDRTLAILHGAGVVLTIGGAAPVVVTTASEPRSFSGDLPTAAELIDGPVMDLNVMTRRGRVGHHMRRLDVQSTQHLDLKHAVLLWVNGSADITTPGGVFQPEPLEALACDAPARWTVTPHGAALFYLIELTAITVGLRL